MAQKGKKTSISKLNARLWRGKREGLRPAYLLLIAVIGIALSVGAYIYQRDTQQSAGLVEAKGGAELRINEVMCDNRTTPILPSGLAPDWIEIINAGSETLDIEDYSLLLESKVNKIFVFPKKTLAPGECTIIWAGGEELRGEWNAPFKLPASGHDALLLMDARGQSVDRMELVEMGADIAYARDEAGNWSATPNATPGERNDSFAQTAKDVSLYESTVEITEACSRNVYLFADENGVAQDYLEIHNSGDAPVDLTGWYLSDAGNNLTRWAFPQLVLAPGDYLAVHCSGLNRTNDINHLHTDFRLGGDGDTIYLSTPEVHTVSMVELPPLEKGQAYSLSEGAWTDKLSPTPGMENTAEAGAQCNYMSLGDVSGSLMISEIVVSPTQQNCDWIEIYNGSSQSIDLSGFGLTDKLTRPHKFTFPAGTVIGANEFMCICFSGLEQEKYADYLNANFKLSLEGGFSVALSDVQGNTLDATFVPEQYSGISYGRMRGEHGFFYLTETTPMAENLGSYYRARASEPSYSVEGGLFSTGDAFEVAISAPAGSRIYYTLDSTDPSDTSTLYTAPIPISSTTILRTRVYRDNCMPSRSDTQSYLFDVSADGAYVVSLVSDPDGLFSEENGILATGPNASPNFPYKGANYWMDWEREAHVEVFSPEGEKVIAQNCGTKIFGAYSRANIVKSLRVIARSEYGSSRFKYPLFSERDYEEYKEFLLRTSGQDYNRTFMRDVVLTSLARDTGLMYQESELGVVYIDGKYYSMVWLRERVSRYSICQFEGWEGMEDSIDFVDGNDVTLQGSNKSYKDLITWLEGHDTTTQEAYDTISSVIDIDNYINYMCIQIMAGNGDTLNVKRYRNPLTDGKWRWVLFDLDWGFSVDTNSIARWLNPKGMGTNLYTRTDLFRACISNPIFREQFLTRFGELLATTFSTENTQRLIEERAERLKPLLPQFAERIGKSSASYTKDYNRIMEYALTRPRKILGYFDGVFNFTDAEKQRYFGKAIEKINEAEAK